MSKRVVVGLSGGVDSSVSAYLLQEQGYEVIGMFMKNWHDESVTLSDECPWIDDSNDALLVAQDLGIPFQTIDLSLEYKDRVVDYMFDEYKNGRTPNPDVLCNREIKFDVFLKAAMDLGADYVATGHYCQKAVHEDGSFGLLAGADKNKDQSYFLCQLTQEQLSKALFPIGHLQKDEVRQIAEKRGLITAGKKDSQGLCFVGKIKLPDFLQQQLLPKEGDVIEIPSEHEVFDADVSDGSAYPLTPEMGGELGHHNGAHYFTVGQRKGLKIGGTPLPLFVIGTDTKKNIVYVGQGENHRGLYRPVLRMKVSEVHWVQPQLKLKSGEKQLYDVRIRYRQTLRPAELSMDEQYYYLHFKTPERGITPGQFAAWYLQDELIGSGVIQ